MRHALLALCLFAIVLLSCKKTIIEEVEGDAFRVSILPVKMEGFDRYKISGTLELRHVTKQVEYGLLLSKSVNPTLENGVKHVLGQAAGSLDFTHELSGLDTGAVYFVRAYAVTEQAVQYSANQEVSKVSPQIYSTENELNYNRPLTIVANLGPFKSSAVVKAYFNDYPLNIISIGSGEGSTMITASIPAQVAPGKYTLSVSFDNLKLSYKSPLTLMEGIWEQLDDLPGDVGWPQLVTDYFVNDDWIYINTLSNTGGENFMEYMKYNYKTRQTIKLTNFAKEFLIRDAATIKQGNFLHYLCGEINGNASATHYVYDTSADRWIQEAKFPGPERVGAISMTANNKIYIGMGYKHGTLIQANNSFYRDMWSYDILSKTWTKLADFPQSNGRRASASFSIGTKLYFTGGASSETKDPIITPVPSKETWCYDTQTNQWSRKADYPGEGAIKFSAFSIGKYGYVGMGESVTYDSYFGRKPDRRFYKYDPEKDKWSEVSNPRIDLVSPFSGTNNNTGIVGGGANTSSYPEYGLYIYTPQQ